MTNSSTGSRTDGFTPSSGSTSKLPNGKVAAITTGALLLGGTALALMGDGRIPSNAKTENGAMPEAGADEVKNTPTLDVMPTADANATFGEAFADARDELGPGALFVWQGKAYHTFTKGEWQDLSLDQRQEFIGSVGTSEEAETAVLQPIAHPVMVTDRTTKTVEPLYIEGTIDGQRVMGIDIDRDGMVDSLVMEGPSGYNYRVLDAQGDEGLDTVYMFDTITQENVLMLKLPDPVALSTDGLNEAIYSPELVQSVHFAMDAEEETTNEPSAELMQSLEETDTEEEPDIDDVEEEELTIQPEPALADEDEELEDLTVYDDGDDEADMEAGEEQTNNPTDSDYSHQPIL